MNPFRQAILEVKNDTVQTALVEAGFPEGETRVKICGADAGAFIKAAAEMINGEYDTIQANYGMVTPDEDLGFSIAAYRGDRMIGQATILLYDTGSGRWPEEHGIWFEGIFVDCNFRGEGVGRNLVDACVITLKAIVLRAQEIDPCSWEFIDPHPSADTNEQSRALVSRFARDFCAFNDDLCARMVDILDEDAHLP